MAARTLKRRRFIVAPFQYQLLGVYVIYLLIILFVFAATVFVPLMVQIDNSSLSFDEKSQVADQFLVLHHRLWLPLLIVFVLLVVHSVIISHRIAGPLYRIRRILKSVGRGDFTVRTTIRSNDYLMKEAEVVNEMAEMLSEKIKDIRRKSGEASATLADLRRSIDSASLDEMEQKLEELSAHLNGLGVRLDEFRIDRREPTRKVLLPPAGRTISR